jgi:hypothetical protein
MIARRRSRSAVSFAVIVASVPDGFFEGVSASDEQLDEREDEFGMFVGWDH